MKSSLVFLFTETSTAEALDGFFPISYLMKQAPDTNQPFIYYAFSLDIFLKDKDVS